MDVWSWLRGLGLEGYAQAFRANDIDAEVLPRLTAEDLIALGVTSVGHRRRLLDAIARLRDGAPPASAELPGAAMPKAAQAERRHLTVLFCDLVGSTALSATLDPEDMRELITAYQSCCAGEITRFEGHVAKFMGDGVLAYFGWPKAHEDDAERAVRAGLAIAKVVADLETPDGTPTAARIGVATGLVVVGDLVGDAEARERAVVGETPNLAARLQALAPPGSVVISQATRRLVGGLFELTDLGPQRLKGFAEPLAAFRVEGEGRAEGRFEALHGERLTPLVGREHELGILLERWAWGKDGDGQVVLLSGEPGIGKSRLTRSLIERLADEPHTRLRYFCSPYHTNSALYPVAEQLERAAGFQVGESAETRLDKLMAVLAEATDHLVEAAPLIAALLAIPTGARYPPMNLTPEAQKLRTFAALLEQVAGLAEQRPVLMVLEDAHWVDPTSAELFGLVIDRIRHLPVLFLITFRPDFSPPWTGHTHVTSLALSRLGQRQGAQMVERLTGNKPVPAEVLQQILLKTDGVPLFVEELTKTVLESGLLADRGDHYELAGPLPPLAIPATLHDSLMARLDRLAPVKEVAQIGAVIGREFSHELLAAVSPLSEADLGAALDQLVSSELVFRRGDPPEATYAFKHALVQDVAYQSLLKSKRQELNARVAEVLETCFPGVGESEPEVLARHFTNAGCAEPALGYWLKAGRRAAERSANLEAVAHLTKGLEVLSALPEGSERRRHELALRTALSGPLMATRGYGSPETIEAYERLRELCEELGETEQLFPVLHGQWVHLIMRAKYREAERLADHISRLAAGHADPVQLLMAHRMSGITMMLMGRLAAGRKHLELAVSLYDAERDRGLALHYVHDPKVAALSYLSTHTWLFGYPDQARQASREAIACARELNHANSLAYALYFAGALPAHLWRDMSAVGKHTDELVALAEEQRFLLWLSWGRMPQGWVLARSGQARVGIDLIRETLAELRRTGHEFYRPWFLYLLAEAHAAGSEFEEALTQVEEALAVIGQTEERWCEAELERLKGELLKRLPDAHPDAAEACFERAMEIARWQEAKSWELRAATSLARLWGERGERQKAHDLLAPVCNWFTEGFETADLRDAKALLDELR
jgi:class 3 adenylate cyclase/predicted ATPase